MAAPVGLWVKPGIPRNSGAREIRRYCVLWSKHLNPDPDPWPWPLTSTFDPNFDPDLWSLTSIFGPASRSSHLTPTFLTSSFWPWPLTPTFDLNLWPWPLTSTFDLDLWPELDPDLWPRSLAQPLGPAIWPLPFDLEFLTLTFDPDLQHYIFLPWPFKLPRRTFNHFAHGPWLFIQYRACTGFAVRDGPLMIVGGGAPR